HLKEFTVSKELFTRGYPADQGPCNCTSWCCEGGVYADLSERDKILQHKEIIKKYIDDSQTRDEQQWFEEDEQEDEDFPSGWCQGTEEINSKCAFLDKRGRCSLQVAATEEGMDRWTLKPLYCILFPIEVSDKIIGFDEMLQDDQPCCTVSKKFDIPLFRACKDELIHLVGEDGYQLMEEYYATLQQRSHGKPQ
ncbi:MAG: DUF3109 family protein, partial [Bacteroidetes bacterium]|nr:DUF3109 family protein [Bacteroidota bacterium]